MRVLIRVSAGTAVALGLLDWKTQEPTTTAYLLYAGSTGQEKCLMSCAYCAQGEQSLSPAANLSRIIWPAFSWEELEPKLARAPGAGLQRVCLQGIRSTGGVIPIIRTLQRISRTVTLPISVSTWIKDCSEVDSLFQNGAERVNISLDVASSEDHASLRKGSLENKLAMLREAVRQYPARITTHLILGLGETEQELLTLAHQLVNEGVEVALFAFTPIRGTSLAGYPAPSLASYRRIQAALYLLRQNKVSLESFDFQEGKLVSLGKERQELREALEHGGAFRTSGCPGCNRPYYNERPGEIPYNYPRPLTAEEEEMNFGLLWKSLGHS